MGWHRTAIIALFFCAATTSLSARIGLSAEASDPQIRAFDLPTIERLGREIYEQDQLAWHASDIVIAKRTQAVAEKDGIAGWITETIAGKSVVRFIKRNAGAPEILYDVTFEQGKEPLFAIPDNHLLSPEETGQFEARTTAVQSAAHACSERYNTIALRDSASDGWLVWALAATHDPDLIIIGGHFRFAISADGKTIRSRDALSKSCLKFPKAKPDAHGEPVALYFNHIVSLTPVETHVFANLQYQTVMYVGTRDGKAWKLDKGSITTVDLDSPDVDGSSARALAGQDERCSIIARKKADPKQIDPVGKIEVINVTESDAPFSLTAPEGYELSSIACSRFDIVPAPNDYKVLMGARIPLLIVDRGAGHPDRTGSLYFVSGRFRYNIDGPDLTPELQARLGKRLDAFQAAIQSKP